MIYKTSITQKFRAKKKIKLMKKSKELLEQTNKTVQFPIYQSLKKNLKPSKKMNSMQINTLKTGLKNLNKNY
jgi:hypothetical protein